MYPRLPLDKSLFWAAFFGALLFNLYWYCVFLSFPLMTEDGASNYSSLVDVAALGPLLTNIPVSFLEGLGQQNLFVTATYDPFAWLMFLDGDKAQLFRFSMALRATACWLTSYLFISALSHGRRSVAIIGAFLSLALNFTLTNPYGMPTYGGVFNATEAALFPLALWIQLRIVRQRRWLGWTDLFMVVTVAFFLLAYPVGSVIGLGALLAYATALVLFSKPGAGQMAAWGLLKLAIVISLLLLTPRWGLYDTWWASINVSARKVFPGELFTYPPGYTLPFLWDNHGPWLVRTMVVFSAAVLLFNRRWPRYLRVVVATLGTVGGISLLLNAARVLGIASGLLDRLPRAFYLEFYLPVFYAAAAAFSIVYWNKILRPSSAHLRRWLTGLTLFSFLAFLLVGPVALLIAVVLALVGRVTGVESKHRLLAISTWSALSLLAFVTLRFLALPVIVIWTILAARPRSGVLPSQSPPPPWPRWGIVTGRTCLAGSLLLGAPLLWVIAPHEIHDLFGDRLHCQNAHLWCKDPAGVTMNAGSHPLTEFLKTKLESRTKFSGRADFLLLPAPRVRVFPIRPGEIPEPTFNQMLDWYQRAYHARQFQYAFWYREPPEMFKYDSPRGSRVAKLHSLLQILAGNADPYSGVLPKDVLKEIVEWQGVGEKNWRPAKISGRWPGIQQVNLMIEERSRNYFTLGNGLLLRSLPLQNIPVATSYEQGLDYLYYLFWTRYVNQGARALRSINFTALETLNPPQLALIGVRYVIARDVPFIPKPSLRRAFAADGYSIYEIPNPNLYGYGPTTILSPETEQQGLLKELKLMRSEAFDPAREVVISRDARTALGRDVELAPMAESEITIEGQSIRFRARSAGHRSLAVLPFKYSRCWKPIWSSGEGSVIRADLALLGVAFAESVDVTLKWNVGYGSSACLKEDAKLLPDAVAAARSIR